MNLYLSARIVFRNKPKERIDAKSNEGIHAKSNEYYLRGDEFVFVCEDLFSKKKRENSYQIK